jgi:hypothetical protein
MTLSPFHMLVAIYLLFLPACATTPQLRSSEASIRSGVEGVLVSRIWIVDTQTIPIFTEAHAIQAGRHRIGLTSSPSVGLQSYGIMDATLIAGHHYRVVGRWPSLAAALNYSALEYTLLDKTTNTAIKTVPGVLVPGFMGNRTAKGVAAEALEQAMGVEILDDWYKQVPGYSPTLAKFLK